MLAAGAAHGTHLQWLPMRITTMNTAQAMGMAMTLAVPAAGLGARR